MKIKPCDKITKRKAMGHKKRPLSWNFMGDPKGEKSEYCFFFQHTDKRQIENISGIIYGQLCLPVEADQIDEKISDLYGRVLVVDTHNQKIDLYKLRRAYNGILKKDVNLYSGKNPDRIRNYMISQLEKMTSFS